MKKLMVLFSLLVFVGVYAAPALTMPKETAAKIVAVDKDKKVKATKTDAKKSGGEAKAACCSSSSTSTTATSGSSCCSGATGFSAACATACQGAAAIKGDGKKTEEKKK